MIPPGKVTTYSNLASILKLHPRVVGKMLSSNSNLVAIPCHRVIKNDRKIGGYKLGWKFKKKLLELEGVKFCDEERVCDDSMIDLKKILLLD